MNGLHVFDENINYILGSSLFFLLQTRLTTNVCTATFKYKSNKPALEFIQDCWGSKVDNQFLLIVKSSRTTTKSCIVELFTK